MGTYMIYKFSCLHTIEDGAINEVWRNHTSDTSDIVAINYGLNNSFGESHLRFRFNRIVARRPKITKLTANKTNARCDWSAVFVYMHAHCVICKIDQHNK